MDCYCNFDFGNMDCYCNFDLYLYFDNYLGEYLYICLYLYLYLYFGFGFDFDFDFEGMGLNTIVRVLRLDNYLDPSWDYNCHNY